MKTLTSQRGISLFEMITVIVIISIVGSIIFSLLFEGFRAYFAARDLSRLTQQGRFALQRIAQDIRQIEPGGLWVVSNTLVAWLEPPPNATLATIRAYGEVPAGTIARFQNSWQPLANNIVPGSFRVRYLQRDGITPVPTPSTILAPATIYYITVSFTLTYSAFDGTTYTIPMSMTAFPRRFQ